MSWRPPFRLRYLPGALLDYITHPVAPGLLERCIVGSTVHPLVWCRRRSVNDELTCARHGKTAR